MQKQNFKLFFVAECNIDLLKKKEKISDQEFLEKIQSRHYDLMLNNVVVKSGSFEECKKFVKDYGKH